MMEHSQVPEKPAWTIIEIKEKIIDDGIAEVTEAYAQEPAKRDGAIDGFEIARSLTSRDQFQKVIQARLMRETRMRRTENEEERDRYLRHRWGTLQLEFVLDCLKVVAWAEPGDLLSSRAMRKCISVLGGQP